MPIPSKRKIPSCLGITILFKEYVGILLTIKIEVTKITEKLIIEIFCNCIKLLKLNIRGNRINPAAAGDGTPSKKFIFHGALSSTTVKLNLAKRRAQHTE